MSVKKDTGNRLMENVDSELKEKTYITPIINREGRPQQHFWLYHVFVVIRSFFTSELQSTTTPVEKKKDLIESE